MKHTVKQPVYHQYQIALKDLSQLYYLLLNCLKAGQSALVGNEHF